MQEWLHVQPGAAQSPEVCLMTAPQIIGRAAREAGGYREVVKMVDQLHQKLLWINEHGLVSGPEIRSSLSSPVVHALRKVTGQVPQQIAHRGVRNL